MIETFSLENCGPIASVSWPLSPYINLIIGENGTGKSLLLKTLYAVVRSMEFYQRGNDTRTFSQILGEKLRGTFQLEQVGDLVRKGGDRLRFEGNIDNQTIYFSFTPSAVQGVGEVSRLIRPRSDALSIFLQPKEILSLTPIVKRSRLQDQIFGFDDTYLDLAIALEGTPTQGRTHDNLAQARRQLSSLYNGRLEQKGEEWVFKQGNARYSIHMTAEGIKRLAIIDRLIGNRSLSPGSILFIDEPEATLHPQAVVNFMEILHLLAQQDIQVIMASHSYFVLKALHIIASREQVDFQILSLQKDGDYETANLREEIPDNPIIDQSIDLYEREVAVEIALA